jgi:hypothetical protein
MTEKYLQNFKDLGLNPQTDISPGRIHIFCSVPTTIILTFQKVDINLSQNRSKFIDIPEIINLDDCDKGRGTLEHIKDHRDVIVALLNAAVTQIFYIEGDVKKRMSSIKTKKIDIVPKAVNGDHFFTS